jgi:hypothetical protein
MQKSNYSFINRGTSFNFDSNIFQTSENKKCLMKFPKNELIVHSNNKPFTKCLMKFPKNELVVHSNNKQYEKYLMKFPKNELIVWSNNRLCIYLLNNSSKCGTT